MVFASGLLKAFHRDIAGVTAIEYALIAGAIAVAIIAAVIALGQDVTNVFTTTGGSIAAVSSSL